MALYSNKEHDSCKVLYVVRYIIAVRYFITVQAKSRPVSVAVPIIQATRGNDPVHELNDTCTDILPEDFIGHKLNSSMILQRYVKWDLPTNEM
jgi:hypothetical protein